MSRPRGRFIVLEGPDKSGKSTQAQLLLRTLRREGFDVLHTREPGGTRFAESIRRLVLSPSYRVTPLAELLLYEAARAQHTFELVRPALKAGRIVLCERYTMATLAYQGYGRGLPLPLVRRLNAVATGGLRPDLTLVLDLPEAAFESRRRAVHDRLERESIDFRRRVREGYRRLSRSPRTRLISGLRGVDEVHREILAVVRRALGGAA